MACGSTEHCKDDNQQPAPSKPPTSLPPPSTSGPVPSLSMKLRRTSRRTFAPCPHYGSGVLFNPLSGGEYLIFFLNVSHSFSDLLNFARSFRNSFFHFHLYILSSPNLHTLLGTSFFSFLFFSPSLLDTCLIVTCGGVCKEGYLYIFVYF